MVGMSQCARCHVDYYHNPDVRILFTQYCDHRVCQPCVDELFRRGRTSACPACGRTVRFEEFHEKPLEARQVEEEVQVRKQICEIYCKSQEDFTTLEEFNDFLTEREDIIYNIVQASSAEDAQETWRQVEKYREQNAEQIVRAQRLQPKKKFQKLLSIIEEEGLFSTRVNCDWGERLAASAQAAEHPLRVRYRELFAQQVEEPAPPYEPGDVSPIAPQPLFGHYGRADLSKQRSGGGQPADLCRKKARHLFFADLAAAARGVALAA